MEGRSSMQIGINTMSTISAMRENFQETVKRLTDGGCSYFEAMSDWGAKKETLDFYAGLTGGGNGWDPAHTLERLEYIRSLGSDIRGIFVFDETIRGQIEELGEYCREAGLQYIVFSFLEYKGLDDIYAKIDLVREVAAVMERFGVQVMMHNHEHDCARVQDKDGKDKEIIDIFLENLSARELALEVDVGWLQYADIDPAAYVKRKMDRIWILHLKDICRDYKERDRSHIFVPCGSGAVDFPAIMKAVQEAGREDMLYVIDQDSSEGDIVEDLVESIAYLKSIGNAE